MLLAMGGGGDIASTIIIGELLRREGLRVIYSAIVWERFVRDPSPGPIGLEEIIGIERYSYMGIALPGCYAVREYSGVVVPAVCKFAEAMREPVVVLDARRGELSVRLGIEEAASLYDCNTIVGVDVGGDVLAKGFEEELWSPLADSISLAAIASSTIDHKVIVVHSPGADGELPRELVFRYISEIATKGGYKGLIGVPSLLLSQLEYVVTRVYTEAGRPAILAARGYYGPLTIRRGTRRINVDICSAASIILDANTVYELSPLAKAVTGTTSIEEASMRLNELGVYTEYDLERDLFLHPDAKEEPFILLRIRETMRDRLRKPLYGLNGKGDRKE